MSNISAAERLTPLWAKVLGTDPSGPDDDFFHSGGTSIEAVYLAAAIQEELGASIDAFDVVMLRRFDAIAEAIAPGLDEAA
jgi:hypothetical protein